MKTKMAEIKKLILKNYFLIGTEGEFKSLQQWLNEQLLHGRKSRARTRFLKLLLPRILEIEEERLRLLKENAEKNEKGEPILLDEEGKETTDISKGVKYKLKDVAKFQQEYANYLNEDFVIDVVPSNKEDIYIVRDIILNTDEKFSGVMATRYDEWCEAFENIK